MILSVVYMICMTCIIKNMASKAIPDVNFYVK